MNKKTYMTMVAGIFTVIGVVHALRLWFGWEVVIGGWMVPAWVSWVAIIVAFFLAWQGFSLSQKR
ncbi:MAG: hypothetical protein HYZ69_02880 [Candidatus Colwellbacteria bacterium]|nr:hypothetical protein [Candidatus Colwellbacteria bacterium]